MSRNTRTEVYRPHRKKLTMLEMATATAREIKRRLVAAGQMADPALRPPKFRFVWSLTIDPEHAREVWANTKGEARALIKAALGLKKSDTLPACIKIERFDHA